MEKARDNNQSMAMSSSSTQKTIYHEKKPGIFGEKAYYRSGSGIIKGKPRTSYHLTHQGSCQDY